MKIIGHTSGSYFVEISDLELAKIIGRRTPVRTGSYSQPPFDQGKELEVCKTWKKLESIVGSAEEMRKRAQSLRGLADVLDGTAELVKRAIEFVPPPPESKP